MIMIIKQITALVVLCVTCTTLAYASHERLFIYFDADRTAHFNSARAIEMGVKTAFDEIDNQLHGVTVEFVVMDHRANMVRSKRNMERYRQDNNAIALFAGLHSPPLIRHRDFINESSLLVLVPWAAGGPITRYPSINNFVFRLSVDDTKVGGILVEEAQQQGCTRVNLLLEKTPWGQSNFVNMSEAITKTRDMTYTTTWFDWGINDARARIMASEISNEGSPCVLFVGNTTEGVTLIEALSTLKEPPKVFSHWGITGGRFVDLVSFESRERVSLTFVQSCFNFYSSAPTTLSHAVRQRAANLFPEEFGTDFLHAPAGFIHAYDLSKLLIEAAKTVSFTDDEQENRIALKRALENIQQPVQGLIKEYKRPFSVYHSGNNDAHEALGAKDLCMGKFDSDGGIVLSVR